jgi:CxxC motif-containing protein (DUF1111 family)
MRFPSGKLLRFLILFVVAAIAGILLSFLFNRGLPESAVSAGGETTVSNRTSHAYGQPAANLSEATLAEHIEGDRAFDAVFVTPPATVNAGLGPLFNNASCIGCHIKDGRGMPQKGQLLVRVSDSVQTTATAKPSQQSADPVLDHYHPEAAVSLGNESPVPNIGTQIQDQGVYGHVPEADVNLEWQEQSGTYGDGAPYQLRSLLPNITLPNGKPLPETVMTSFRIPSPVFGLGLLEAIPEAEILRHADPDDGDRDGISGRPNQVWDVEAKSVVLGRFGWKANNPNLRQQNASAYVNDMGVTNPLFPEADGSSEVDEATLKTVTTYVQTLAVPARTLLDDPAVQRGEQLFAANCATCHVSTLRTGKHALPELSNQTIHPYTDLLLHDMGKGLADGRPDFQASGQEWRTAPLWGIGLTQTVLPYSGYLHDGRARTLEEAILWHGGEAETAKETFRTLPKGDRDALIRFLNSL